MLQRKGTYSRPKPILRKLRTFLKKLFHPSLCHYDEWKWGENERQKSSMDDALNRMVAVASAAAGEQPAFIPSATWKGSKEGYYFGTTKEGTGYHVDAYQQQEE